ncbi:MAG: hypothetical protein DUD39_05125 [Coriobacteriaceae bacterium]|jgi:hypothetical protein|nr:MAG: hypothetical protein DUD39_05125 [Coriobacteriaceae bacterium]
MNDAYALPMLLRQGACQEDIDTACQALPLKCGGERTMIHAEANTNISHPESVIPAVRYQVVAGENVLVTLVCMPCSRM